ncbi:MAG: hypothetical protein ACOY16_06230 [Chloroflexota bacterium]
MYMVQFILNDPQKLDELLEAWNSIGVRGVTIIESTGFHRRLRKLIPMRYMFQPMEEITESHYTLFSVVESMEKVQACLQTVEKLVGDLDLPHTGIFTAWPLAVVKGLPIGNEAE